jgi:isopenicillin N synthase-like dioxygenase
LNTTDSFPGNAASIPTIDLATFLNGSAERRRLIAAEVDEICRSLGFLIITGHGVSQDVNTAAWTMARAFFDLPVRSKLAVKATEAGSPRGYFPLEKEALAKSGGVESPPDRKECYSSGPLSPPEGHVAGDDFDFFYGPNIWPTEPAGFMKAWTDYYSAMEKLGSRIMQMLAEALQLDKDYFAGFHTHHLGALRALNYPAIADDKLPGQQRAGAHSDYGSVTILKADSTVSGLEIQNASGYWVSAPVVADSYIVNIGDLLARWTNDRWVSTMHRVVEPATDSAEVAPRRQSIAYFMNPNYDARISAITTCVDPGQAAKYPNVLAGQYLIQQFRSTDSENNELR